jgi:hypothetical protein
MELERRKMHLLDLKMIKSCVKGQYLRGRKQGANRTIIYFYFRVPHFPLFFPHFIFLKKEEYEEK